MGHPLKKYLTINTNNLPEIEGCIRIPTYYYNYYELRVDNPQLKIFDLIFIYHDDEDFCCKLYLVASNNKKASRSLVDLFNFLYDTVDSIGLEKHRYPFPQKSEINLVESILKNSSGEWNGRFWYHDSMKKYPIKTVLSIEDETWLRALLDFTDYKSMTKEVSELFKHDGKKLVLELASFDTMHGSFSINSLF